MAMKWFVRLAIGVFLGALAALGLSFFLHGWMIPAAAGALLGVIGFLGSFFLWSADLPPSPENPQGYEQVLFDLPNSIASVALIGGIVALAFFLPFDAPAGPSDAAYLAARDPLLADLETLHDNFAQLRDDYGSGAIAADAFSAELQKARTASRELYVEAKALAPPASREAEVLHLRVAAEQLSAAIESMDLCVSGIEARCQTAADRLSDHEKAFARALGKEPAADAEAAA